LGLGDADTRVRENARASLVRITRQDFGADARAWTSWWSKNSARHRVEWLIDALVHEARDLRQAASEELRSLSKEYFGFAVDLPPRERERAQQRWRDWWATEGKFRFREQS
jgi:hypothetical protein